AARFAQPGPDQRRGSAGSAACSGPDAAGSAGDVPSGAASVAAGPVAALSGGAGSGGGARAGWGRGDTSGAVRSIVGGGRRRGGATVRPPHRSFGPHPPSTVSTVRLLTPDGSLHA